MNQITNNFYQLSTDDIGCIIKLEATPVHQEVA